MLACLISTMKLISVKVFCKKVINNVYFHKLYFYGNKIPEIKGKYAANLLEVRSSVLLLVDRNPVVEVIHPNCSSTKKLENLPCGVVWGSVGGVGR